MLSAFGTHYQHIRFGNGISLFIGLLTVHHNLNIWIDVVVNVVLGNREHATCSTGRIEYGTNDSRTL